MPNPFPIVPIDPNDKSKGYKFVLAKNGGAKVFTTAINPKQLSTPSISLSGNILTINNVENATTYKIYQNTSFLVKFEAAEGETTTYDLATLVYPVANGIVKVVAVNKYKEYADSYPASLSQPFPGEQTDKPVEEQIQIDGSHVVIDTPSDYIRITLVGDTETVFKDFMATASEIDLRTIQQGDTGTLPEGYYEIYIQYGEDGKAISDPYAAGVYRRLVVNAGVYMLWQCTENLTILDDGGI